MKHVISLGAGVQSTTLALMAKHRELLPLPDCAIFADTGEEPEAVYRHLQWLTGCELESDADERVVAVPGSYQSGVLPFVVHVAAAWGRGTRVRGPLGDEILRATRGEAGFHSRPPVYVKNFDGDTRGGIIRRQCTRDFKIDVISAEVRKILGIRRGQRWPHEIMAEQWIGISTDEASRAKPIMARRRKAGAFPHPTIKARWPLLDRLMSRADCVRWLERNGYATPPKSACTFCPFHSDSEWRRLRNEDAKGWKRAVLIDAALRQRGAFAGLNGELFLHRSLKPLAEVDLSTAEDRGQLNMFENECEGMCGV